MDELSRSASGRGGDAPDTVTARVEVALERAALAEPRVRAFAWLDAERARRLAREMGEGASPAGGKGPGRALRGALVGLKDVIDTAGIPTECGARLFEGRVPARSAVAAECLEAAGALMLGKTVTAECAFFHPGPTRNPWDTRRTSGGSSMGSAAAVAAGMLDAAVGTQTNGSVIRPAAFCGVVGFKPTFGRIPRDGVMEFSTTLDHLGSFARTVELAARTAAVMAGDPAEAWWAGGAGPFGERAPRFVVARTAEWAHADPVMRERFEADVAALRAAGAEVVDAGAAGDSAAERAGAEAALPAAVDASVPVHRTIMQYEGAQALGATVAAQPEKASDTLRGYVEEGARIPRAEYEAALAERERLIPLFTAWAAQFDAVLTPPTTGEAPGAETTGEPRFCTRWTLVGAPAITLPTGLGPHGLPLGLQLVGAPGQDARLLAAAAWAERHLVAPVWTPERLSYRT